MPRQASKNPMNATFPHCPGETQTSSLISIITTKPKFVGLKTWRSSIRIRNLLDTVRPAASIASVGLPVLSSKLRDSPEMSALRGSKRGTCQKRVQAY